MSLKVGESERAMANLPYFLLGRTRRGWRGVRGAPKLAGGTYGVCLPLAMAIILGDHGWKKPFLLVPFIVGMAATCLFRAPLSNPTHRKERRSLILAEHWSKPFLN